LFKNPVDDLISDHGMLGMMRRTGFAIAADIHHSAASAANSIDAQIDAMASHLVTAIARPVIQLMNFNESVDHIGNCGHRWSAAIAAADGSGPGPAHAMGPVSKGGCGAVEALNHARAMGANDILFGVMANVAVFLISLFIWFVAVSTFLVGTKALFYAVVVCPALFAGMVWQRAKFYASNCAGQLGLHGLQMLIFTVCLALGITAIEWVLTTDMFGSNPVMVVPRLILAGLAAIVGMVMFHWVDKHWYTHSWGTITHSIGGAWTSSRDYAHSEFDDMTRWARRKPSTPETDATPAAARPGSKSEAAAQKTGDKPAAAQFEVIKPRPAAQAAKRAETRVGQLAKAKTARVVGEVLVPEVAAPITAAAAAHRTVKRKQVQRADAGDWRIYQHVAAELAPTPPAARRAPAQQHGQPPARPAEIATTAVVARGRGNAPDTKPNPISIRPAPDRETAATPPTQVGDSYQRPTRAGKVSAHQTNRDSVKALPPA
jgi:hypothetical protein